MAGPAFGFANGFAGAVKEPGKAAFRPSGLAVGPDGALYISDDVHGRIWRVVYKGEAVRRRRARDEHRLGIGVPGTSSR